MSSRQKKTATRKLNKRNGKKISRTPSRKVLGLGLESLEDRRLLAFSDFLINEVLADPASGSDPNGDGFAHNSQDEFIEIVNNGPAIDIGGWALSDVVASRHVFPSPTNVAAGQAVLVFGGGTPTGSFGDALVMTSSGGTLGLNNGGDTITLTDNASTTTMTYGSEGGNNNSLTRDPDLVGTFFQHNETSSGLDYSPGFQNDGTTPFGGGAIVGILAATETGGSTVVSESGSTDTVNVSLSGTPTSNVTVSITPSDAQIDLGAGAGTALTLTFTPGNANDAQVVTIAAIDDEAHEGGHSATLSFATSSNDASFNGLSSAPITVAIQDNDAAVFNAGSVVINEVDADTADENNEFIELYDGGVGNTALDGLVVVLFNGNGSVAYGAIDLDGFSTDADGYFVLGDGDVPSVDLVPPGFDAAGAFSFGSDLQNGEDGVAIYVADATDFSNGTTAVSANLQDAVVYETGPDSDSTLPADLNLTSVMDEAVNGSKDTESVSRVPNGTGPFSIVEPTPGAPNSLVVLTPEIDVTGNGQSISSGEVVPTPAADTDFGSAVQGSVAVTRTFSIANSGTGALWISSASISGSNDFVVSQPANSIAAGATSAFTVTFTPSTVGSQTATVSVANNDADENPYTFDVTGTVSVLTVPEIDVTGNGQSIVDGDTTPDSADGTDFGSVNAAAGSVTKTFTISNPGTAALSINGVTINGANADDFSLGALPSSIAANGSSTFDVTFDPAAAGLRTAAVTVASNDGDEASYDFAVQGTGLTTATNIVINEVDADTSDENNEFIELYDGGAGNTPLDGLVVVLFNGNGSVSYSSIDLDGQATDANGYFVIGDGDVPSVDLVPNGFDSAGAGAYGSDLQNGEDGVALFTGNATDFPNGTVASTANLLDAIVYETGVDANSTLLADFGITAVVDENSNGSKDTESVSRAPNGTGGFVATSATPGATNATVVLTPEINVIGSGQPIASGDVTPDVLDGTDFGSAVQGSAAVTQTFTVANIGSAALNVSAASISGSTDFTISQPASSIAAGSTSMFTVTFTPGAVGSQSATISIASDDADENPYSFDVTGNTTATPTPEIDVTGNGESIADGDTTPGTADDTDFGTVDVDAGTATKTYSISNSGTAPLSISGITISGANTGDFAIDAVPTTVAAGGTETFAITFDPTAVGAQAATITISSDDADEASYDFAVQGEGTTTTTPNETIVVINEVDSETTDENNEFIELYDGGVGNKLLTGLVVVLFNGNGSTSYGAFDLDGFSTNADGFFVIGDGDVAGVGLVPSEFDVVGGVTFTSDIQDGQGGVALFMGNATDFPNGTAASSRNLVDAVVYETGSEADSTLLADLDVTAAVDEDSNGSKDTDSFSRSVDGTGAFVVGMPTPAESNVIVIDNGDDAIQLRKYLWDINGLPDLHNDLVVGDELMYSFDVTNTGLTVLSDVSVADALPGLTMTDSIVEPYVAYDQLNDLSSPPGAYSSLDGDLDSDPHESKLWDNFTVGSSTIVDAVTWLGSFDGATPVDELDTEFSIEVYENAGSAPGSLLHSFVASGENLTAVQMGGAYEYHAMFPFTTLQAGDYWLSITAAISAEDPAAHVHWYWHQGANPGGIDGYYSYVDPYRGDGTPNPETFVAGEDLAYTLHASRLLDFDGTLQPGDTVMFMATYYVTQADIDAGQIVNTATASGTGATATVTDTDSETRAITQIAAMSVRATVNGVETTTDERPEVEVGSVLTWSYEVSNDGNVSLEEFEVVSEHGMMATLDASTDENGDGLLSPGESWTFTVSEEATDGEYGSMDTITSSTRAGATLSSQAPTYYVGIGTGEPAPQHADFDGDGVVGFTDFLALSRHFGLEVDDHSQGDATGDGVVSFADFVLLSHSFGDSVPSPSAAAVDEVFAV